MATALDQIIVQLWRFIEPLDRAVASEEQLELFLERLGYRLDAASLSGALGEIGPLGADISGLGELLGGLTSPADITAAIAGQATIKVGTIFGHVRELASAGPNFAALQFDGEIFVEIFDILLHDYLRATAPAAAELLILVEGLVYEPMAANSAPGRAFAYTKIRFDWGRLGQIFQDLFQGI